MSNADSLAAISAAYAANQQQPSVVPAPQQVPPGFYLASDGRMYPLPTQTPAAPPPAPAPAPAYAPPPAPGPAPALPGAQIPPQQAAALATQHAQQALPINPPEAQQALSPATQAVMPEPRKRRGKAKAAPVAGASAEGSEDLADLLAAVAAALPKGCSVTVVGEA